MATGGSFGGSTIELGVAVTGVSQAVSDLGKIKRANDEVGDSGKAAGDKVADAAKKAVDEEKRLEAATKAAANEASVAQQKMSAFAAGLGQLGSILGGETGGLIGRMSQFASSGISLGQTFGPTGAVVGGIAGAFIPALTELRDSTRHAEEEMRAAQETADNLAHSFLEASRGARSLAAAQLEARAQEGLTTDQVGIRLASEDALFAQRDRALRDIQTAQESISDASRDGAGAEQYVAAQTRRLTELQEQFSRVATEIERRARDASDAAADAGDIATGQNGRNATGQTPAPARRGGGGQSAAQRAEADFLREMASLQRELQFAEEDRAAALLFEKEKIEQVRAEELAQAEAVAASLAEIDARELEYAREIADATREKAEAQKELAEAAQEASATFRTSWTNSVDAVVQSWHAANAAAAAAGQEQIGIAQLMEGSITSAANSIADSVGGTMTSAFETALGAWLDGSKGFVEAAEDMMKGVVKALVIESIVQTVVEGARAIASFASYDIAGGVGHLGAAAAWAAVGVVAGGIGAATGSFGGGGAKGSATDAGAPRETAQNNQRPAGNTVINVYPGGFVTRGEVVAGVYEAINEGGRMGMQFDGAAVGA